MSLLAARVSHLRVRGGPDHSRVTFVELFFDLVFVFAVTQLSHGVAIWEWWSLRPAGKPSPRKPRRRRRPR
jgi:low temperature requirement protein LtrA